MSGRIRDNRESSATETYVELLDVGALGVRRRHDSGADDLDRARAAPVAASHLRDCSTVRATNKSRPPARRRRRKQRDVKGASGIRRGQERLGRESGGKA